MIPESHETEPLQGQPPCPSCVFFFMFGMLPPIDLDHKLVFEADEIHDVRTDRRLPTELETGKLLISEAQP